MGAGKTTQYSQEAVIHLASVNQERSDIYNFRVDNDDDDRHFG